MEQQNINIQQENEIQVSSSLEKKAGNQVVIQSKPKQQLETTKQQQKSSRNQQQQQSQIQELKQIEPKEITIDYKKMVKTLKQPITGNDNQKQQIQQQQEKICEKFILKFKERKDDAGRLIVFNSGVIQELINIFETRDTSTITPVYVESYLILTYPSEKEDLRPIIFAKKNPFPGLIRILEHSNNEVVYNSISAIGSIIIGNLGSIQTTEPHPLFGEVEACDGINKIFSIFNKTTDKKVKDTSAVCLGRLFHSKEMVNQEMKIQIISHLKSILNDPDDWTSSQSFRALEFIARNKANRSEVVRGIDLSTIIEEMKKTLIGNDQEKKSIQFSQELHSFYLSNMIQDMKECTEFRRQAIKSGLVDSLINIFESWELTAITRKITDAFFELTIKDHRFVADLLNPIQRMYPGLIRLLDHEESLVITDSLCSIHIILSSSQQNQINAHHPHYSDVCAQDGIRKIFQVLKRKENNKFNLEYTYKCLDILLQDHEIPDQYLRSEIISFIFTVVTNPTHPQNQIALDTLCSFAKMPKNLSEILKLIDLDNISRDFNKPIVGNEEQMKQIQQQQEGHCKLLSVLLNNRKDDQLRKSIIKAGIADSLINIFINREISTITPLFASVFYLLTKSSNEINSMLYSNNLYPSLLRLLTHTNSQIASHSIYSMYNIITSVSPNTSSSSSSSSSSSIQHPHYKDVASNGGIEKIISFMKRPDISAESEHTAANCVLHLYNEKEVQYKTDNVKLFLNQLSQGIKSVQQSITSKIMLPCMEKDSEVEKNSFVVLN